MQKFYWTSQKYNSSFKEHTVANSAPHPTSRYPTLPIPVNTTQCEVQVPIPSRDPADQHHQQVTKSVLSSQCSGNTNQLSENCSPAKYDVKAKIREFDKRNRTWNQNTLYNAQNGKGGEKRERRQSIQHLEFFKHNYENVYNISDKNAIKMIQNVHTLNLMKDAEEKLSDTTRQTPRSCKNRKLQKPVNRTKSCDRERMGNAFLDSYSILQAVAARAIPCVQPSCYNSGRLSPTGSMDYQGTVQECGKFPSAPAQNLADRMRGRLEYVNKKMSMIRSRSAERLRGCTSAVKSEQMAAHVNVEIIPPKARRKSLGIIRGKPGNIAEVLEYLNMEEHLPVFVLNGYENLSLLKDLDAEELDYLGISDEEQRDNLVTMADLMFHKEVTRDKERDTDDDEHSSDINADSNNDENSCKISVNKEKMKLKRIQSIIK